MEKLAVLIIVLLAVLSTPLTLKRLIDHANRRYPQKQDGDKNPQPDDSKPSAGTYKTYDDDDDWS